MSSGYWQTERQREQYSTGNTTTRKVEDYIKTWEDRCYFDGIPDSVPSGLMKSMRVPSYKAIALAILRNDPSLKSIGFAIKPSRLCEEIRTAHLEASNVIKQIRLL